MQFALLVKSHANVRYAQSLLMLAARECECLLFALHVKATVRVEPLGGSHFLILETDSLDDAGWAYLSRHSSVCLAAVKNEEWLRPLALKPPLYLEPDLPQVLKYKGKTNADFTAMMLHCARSASAFALSDQPLVVLDPLCGRGTSLFCALMEGDHALGIDTDDKAIHEADVYFERYLQFHRLKHRREDRSLTLRQGGCIKERRFIFSNDAEQYKQGNTRTLRMIVGDTNRTAEIAGVESCHLIIGDLPYGVQHAPKEGQKISSFSGMLQHALPEYRKALKPGGAIALAFNTYTLSRAELTEAMRTAGLCPMTEPPFDHFEHWVEQAVNRDMVVAVKK